MSENAVVYARYSSRGQQEQSIEGQLAAAKKYAKARGYQIIHEYCDRAKTGTNDNREAFQQMLKDCAKHTFTVIVVWKVDRFGRNREEITFNKHKAKKHGVRVEYVAESIGNGPESVILESVLEGMAEYYSLQLSQNVRRGLLESAKKHHVIGGWPPFGYRTGPDRSYVVDPSAAPIVREIFDKYAGGMTLFQLLRWLEEKGYRTARGKAFSKSVLARLLQDERYIGVYTFKDIIRDEDAIPAIVEKKTFRKVQEMMKTNKRQPSASWDYADYLLTGKLFCGRCGSPMVGTSGYGRHGAKYSYYACSGKLHRHGCRKKPVRQELLEDAVLTAVHNLLQDDDLIAYIVDKTWEFYEAEAGADKSESLRKELAGVERSIGNLVHSMEIGAVSDAIVGRLSELESQKAALQKALAENELEKPLLTKDLLQFYLQHFRDMDFEDRQCQKRMIATFVNSIFVHDDKVTITFNYSDNGNETVTLSALQEAESSDVSRLAGEEGFEPP